MYLTRLVSLGFWLYHRFFDDFRGYRQKPLTWNRLITYTSISHIFHWDFAEIFGASVKSCFWRKQISNSSFGHFSKNLLKNSRMILSYEKKYYGKVCCLEGIFIKLVNQLSNRFASYMLHLDMIFWVNIQRK